METYVSCDVETDGPIPNPNSMLQLGAAAFDRTGKLLDTFTANLETLPDGEPNPSTMEWWAKQNDLYEKTRTDLEKPEVAMQRFHKWLKKLPGRPVFVGYPVAWDFSFVYWYLMRYVGDSPFSHSALDIKTLAMVALKSEYRNATKKSMPKTWFSERQHSHVAVEDAIEQGELFFAIMRELDQID